MDPLTALGLASNIIQLITFASDLVSKGHEIYKSADGALVEHLELEAIATNLQNLSTDLSIPAGGTKEKQLSNTDKRLRRLCNDCEAVSAQLIEAINGLKVNGNHRKWNSFRQALKSIWVNGEIEELSRRLERYRSEIDTTLLVSIREQTQRHKGEVRGSNVNDDSKKWQAGLMKELHLTRLELQNQQDVMTYFSMKVSAYSKETRERLFRQQIWRKLRFTDIADRHEKISDAYKKTFEWIFMEDGSMEENPANPRSSFIEWLKSPENLYWITGKPGSGKSTLMKYIYNDPRTLEQLQSWADEQELIRAGFFFWNSGTVMQMSRMGLLQALLYESVEEDLEMIPVLFPERWKSYELFGGDLHPWSWSELSFAFKTLISDKSKRFFFLIDGLDEFDGDCGELASFVLQHSTNQNVKICVASRSWLVFEDAFQRWPSLRVEELTAKDINLFVSEKLRGNDMFIKHESIQPTEAQDLIVEITDKAVGVFLWVRLVVVSLLEGLRDGDNIKGLQNRLLLLPPDLEDLFFKILDNLNPDYFEEASKIFQLVHAADEPLSLLNLSRAEEGIEQAMAAGVEAIPVAHEEFKAETMRRRLNSRCKGLLEASGSINDGHLAPVQYLHRTVKDFFESSDRWEYILSGASHFDPAMSLCGAYLLQLKALNLSTNTVSLLEGGKLVELMRLCTRYSIKIDEKNPDLYIKILKEVDRVVYELFDCVSPQGESWLVTIAKDRDPLLQVSPTDPWVFITRGTAGPMSSFFEYALRNQLHSYIIYELTAGRDSNSLCSGLPLLSVAVHVWDPRMVQILFDHTADPNLNSTNMSSTPWIQLLRNLDSSFETRPTPKSTKDSAKKSIVTTSSNLDAKADIVLNFLENKADPKVAIGNLSPKEIIQGAFLEWNAERTSYLLAKLPVPRTTQKSRQKPARGLKKFLKTFRGQRLNAN